VGSARASRQRPHCAAAGCTPAKPATYDDRGYLFIVDRLKDMIVTGGENVYSAEVENALAGHPAVAACAVIGVPDPTWGERVHAVVVLQPGREVTGEELREFCPTPATTRNLAAGTARAYTHADRQEQVAGMIPVRKMIRYKDRELGSRQGTSDNNPIGVLTTRCSVPCGGGVRAFGNELGKLARGTGVS
jgi:AMP-binding enzyme